MGGSNWPASLSGTQRALRPQSITALGTRVSGWPASLSEETQALVSQHTRHPRSGWPVCLLWNSDLGWSLHKAQGEAGGLHVCQGPGGNSGRGL